ncbi:PREDICTED: heterogeneous nuclear ribonucleo [Prunus dulcis]|uniref:PREDICTED: heterogeneous nuclear ribonucleo n=1 Tax=Prunus dulcis TaxID=3755 RepID=A0A5E4F931_PRUDU|nr:putative mediator of RNA polymerase II transcription subunit 26 [Prunus dulcis]KAI5349272.1 hypothetical protein L3X38_002159 [Prunus dulcis]VVA24613.1 PREDICTED: heterogeneous nuclear ribonucleo [Prunus dulcis]
MTSHEVKNQVRDSFEQGFDSLHSVADVVTFPLAPLDGAIHGTSRGVLNWLTDTHPEDRSNSKQKGLPNGGGYGGGHGRGYGGGNGRNGGGYPLGINPNRKLVTVKGNQISDNNADAQAFNNFANKYNGGYNGHNYHDNGQGFNNSGNRNNGGYNGQNHDDDDNEDDAIFGFSDNKISGNKGKVKGFNDFGNQYF